MRKLTISIIIICLFFNKIYSQNIDSISHILDNTIYTHLIYLDYKKTIDLPDSTKRKFINILDGYLPSKVIKETTFMNDAVIKNIEQISKDICGTDTLCFIYTKDSIIKSSNISELEALRSKMFPQNFILAIGSWNIKEAEPILLKNINNPRYPKRETLLALAKLGNDSIKNLIMKKYTIEYVVNNSMLKTNDPELVYNSPPDFLYDFYTTGMYLKSKQILLNMVDLLDIEGKVYFFEDLIPIEENIIMQLNLRFMERNYIKNDTLQEWDSITNNYFCLIDESKNSEDINRILSTENKGKIKIKLKKWINTNVIF